MCLRTAPHCASLRLTPLCSLRVTDLGVASVQFTALALIPIPKYSILLPVIGIPFERAIYHHRQFGRLAVLTGFTHGTYAHRLLPAVAQSRFLSTNRGLTRWNFCNFCRRAELYRLGNR